MKRLVSLFFCVFALAGCSDPHSKIRGEFLAGCIQSGTSKSICTCAFEKVENHYGAQLENTAPAQVSPFIAQSMLECRNEQSSSKASPTAATDNFKTAFMQAMAPSNPATPSDKAANDSAVGTDVNASLKALDKVIAEQVNLRTQYGGGAEYRDGRKVIETDFNRDGSPDAAVLYTIEGAGGGNASVKTLQLFLGNQGSYVAEGSTIVDGASDITLGGDGSVLVHSLMHGPDDPDCCPSIRSSVRYRVEGNQLLQVP